MKVGELIERLGELDPTLDVEMVITTWGGTERADVEDVVVKTYGGGGAVIQLTADVGEWGRPFET